MQGTQDLDARKKNLYRMLGTTSTGQPVAAVSHLTPEQRQDLEYMSKTRALMPDVKEVKKAFLPSRILYETYISSYNLIYIQAYQDKVN